MARIGVRRTGEATFEVVVAEADGETRHSVIAAPQLLERLGEGHEPEAVIEAAFRFLLDREPKESILSRFELLVIGRYFADFEAELPRYLDAAKD